MSSLRIDRIRWVSLGIRMVYGPEGTPAEHLKQINYFRALHPGQFRHGMYQHYMHVQLDELIHAYANAEDPYDSPTGHPTQY